MERQGDLSPEQVDKILQLQDLTGIAQVHRCREILEAHEWNIEAAVQDTFNEQEGAPTVYHQRLWQEERAPQVSAQPVSQRVYQFPRRRPQGILSWAYHLLTVPLRFIWTSCFDLLWALLSILRPDPRQYVTDPVSDVTNFISSFESRFGQNHPVFYQGSYSQALNDAKRELRFVLVYLHAEDNQYVDQFCREILCNPAFVNFVNTRMLFWACSVKSPEGYRVSKAMRERAHPFLAVVVLRNNRMIIAARIEGNIPGTQELIDRLEIVMADNEQSLAAVKAEREQLSFNQTLRQQQDEAYLESLRTDQEKERRRREERQRLELEELRRQLEKEKREQQLLEREQQKKKIKGLLPHEPEPDHPDSICVVLKLPSGSRIERRFLRNQSLKWLFYYVFCHKDCPEDFQIVTNFPRRALPCEPKDGHVEPPSFQEAGLGKSEMLFVHDNQA